MTQIHDDTEINPEILYSPFAGPMDLGAHSLRKHGARCLCTARLSLLRWGLGIHS